MKAKLVGAALITVGLLLGASLTARAAWVSAGIQNVQMPRADRMAPAAPSKQTAGGAAEVHATVTAGSCIQFICDVDCRYLTSLAASATTCTSTTCFPLPLKTTKTMCLPSTQDYVSIWMTAAGDANISVLKDPG